MNWESAFPCLAGDFRKQLRVLPEPLRHYERRRQQGKGKNRLLFPFCLFHRSQSVSPFSHAPKTINTQKEPATKRRRDVLARQPAGGAMTGWQGQTHGWAFVVSNLEDVMVVEKVEAALSITSKNSVTLQHAPNRGLARILLLRNYRPVRRPCGKLSGDASLGLRPHPHEALMTISEMPSSSGK